MISCYKGKVSVLLGTIVVYHAFKKPIFIDYACNVKPFYSTPCFRFPTRK